jgi:GT2 family glycosyltransferase
MLNLHQSGFPYFEWARVLDAIHCGCAVVTEHSMDYYPLRPGTHFASARPEDLGDVVEWIAKDEATRQRLATSAYEMVRSELPLARSAEALVAAAAELDRPVGYGSLMSKALSSALRARIAASLSESEPVIVPPTPYRQDPETAEIRGTLKEIRLDLLEIRRAVKRTELLATRGVEPQRVRIRFESPLWHVIRSPKVSILTALYNHGSEVGGALDSVLSSRMTDIEVVITDDGSADGGAEAVEAWSVAHPEVPLLLVQHPVNRGLGAARNTALDFARGECCFILDADNAVYPNTVEDLVEGLSRAPEAGFAYGYLAMYQGGRPFGLLSWYPWEPSRLRSGNYIDAMALFRTELLRKFGGYTSDRRLYGWEDYDLYCRFAENGLSGEFVPQIVGRYGVSPSSMRSISDLSYNTAFAALKEHCPELMKAVALPL